MRLDKDRRVRLSLTLDQDLARRLRERAEEQSLSVAQYVDGVIRAAILDGELVRVSGDRRRDQPTDEAAGTAEGQRLPRSVGIAEAEFDARDTEAWLEAHWGRD